MGATLASIRRDPRDILTLSYTQEERKEEGRRKKRKKIEKNAQYPVSSIHNTINAKDNPHFWAA
jgi:hypothetical protein